jgi:hypothetical protein
MPMPVDQVVPEVNGFLRGRAGYFRCDNPARQFDKIGIFALAWFALIVSS